MRKVLIVLAASATATLASASNFAMPNSTQTFGPTPSISNPQQDEGGSNVGSTTAVPAPGSAVVALAGVAMLGRRRRDR